MTWFCSLSLTPYVLPSSSPSTFLFLPPPFIIPSPELVWFRGVTCNQQNPQNIRGKNKTEIIFSLLLRNTEVAIQGQRHCPQETRFLLSFCSIVLSTGFHPIGQLTILEGCWGFSCHNQIPGKNRGGQNSLR